MFSPILASFTPIPITQSAFFWSSPAVQVLLDWHSSVKVMINALPLLFSSFATLLRASSFCPALEAVLETCLVQVSLLPIVTPKFSISFITARVVLPNWNSGLVGILFLDIVINLHLNCSNVSFHLLAQTLFLSKSIFRLVVIALGSSVDLISQNRVKSPAYR